VRHQFYNLHDVLDRVDLVLGPDKLVPVKQIQVSGAYPDQNLVA
jgi:hypothetical protein